MLKLSTNLIDDYYKTIENYFLEIVIKIYA